MNSPGFLTSSPKPAFLHKYLKSTICPQILRSRNTSIGTTRRKSITQASFLTKSLDERKKSWESLKLEIVTITIQKHAMNSSQLADHIEQNLKVYGEPIRWAITTVDESEGTCCIEAVVSKTS